MERFNNSEKGGKASLQACRVTESRKETSNMVETSASWSESFAEGTRRVSGDSSDTESSSLKKRVPVVSLSPEVWLSRFF